MKKIIICLFVLIGMGCSLDNRDRGSLREALERARDNEIDISISNIL